MHLTQLSDYIVIMKSILTAWHTVSIIALIIFGITALLFGTIRITIDDAEAVVEDIAGNGQENIDVCDPKLDNLGYRLDGNATDPDGGTVASFRWTIQAVPEGGSANIEEDASGSTSPQASLFINNGCGSQGAYIVKLAAQDDDSQMGSDVVTINVNQPLLNTT